MYTACIAYACQVDLVLKGPNYIAQGCIPSCSVLLTMTAEASGQGVNYTIHRLVNPTDTDVKDVTNTLAQCFHEDKFVHIVTGHDPALYVPFFKSQVVAAVIDGVIYVAQDATGRLIGAAVWFGPGQEMFATPRQEKEAWQPFEDMFSLQLKRWWDDVLTPVDDAFVLKSFGPGTKRRGWHLQVIGIIPQYQRMGIATKIISEVRQIASADHLPMTLEVETQTNVDIYSSLGFKLKHKVDGCGPWGDFSMYGMMTQT